MRTSYREETIDMTVNDECLADSTSTSSNSGSEYGGTDQQDGSYEDSEDLELEQDIEQTSARGQVSPRTGPERRGKYRYRSCETVILTAVEVMREEVWKFTVKELLGKKQTNKESNVKTARTLQKLHDPSHIWGRLKKSDKCKRCVDSEEGHECIARLDEDSETLISKCIGCMWTHGNGGICDLVDKGEAKVIVKKRRRGPACKKSSSSTNSTPKRKSRDTAGSTSRPAKHLSAGFIALTSMSRTASRPAKRSSIQPSQSASPATRTTIEPVPAVTPSRPAHDIDTRPAQPRQIHSLPPAVEEVEPTAQRSRGRREGSEVLRDGAVKTRTDIRSALEDMPDMNMEMKMFISRSGGLSYGQKVLFRDLERCFIAALGFTAGADAASSAEDRSGILETVKDIQEYTVHLRRILGGENVAMDALMRSLLIDMEERVRLLSAAVENLR